VCVYQLAHLDALYMKHCSRNLDILSMARQTNATLEH